MIDAARERKRRLQRLADRHDLVVMESPPEAPDFKKASEGLALAELVLERIQQARVGVADSLEWHRLDLAADAVSDALEFVREWETWQRSNP